MGLDRMKYCDAFEGSWLHFRGPCNDPGELGEREKAWGRAAGGARIAQRSSEEAVGGAALSSLKGQTH